MLVVALALFGWKLTMKFVYASLRALLGGLDFSSKEKLLLQPYYLLTVRDR